MLELKPNCEFCDTDLPPDSMDARICSYECTFCRHCVEDVLKNVCPNCGGGFSPRPVRPATSRVKGTGLQHHPASERRIHTRFDQSQITNFSDSLQTIPPEDR